MEASLAVQVDGQLVFITRRMNAALAGLGLAYVPEDQIGRAHV